MTNRILAALAHFLPGIWGEVDFAILFFTLLTFERIPLLDNPRGSSVEKQGLFSTLKSPGGTTGVFRLYLKEIEFRFNYNSRR